MWKAGEGVVLKFGGSSVATPERICAAARRIASFARQGRKTVVVVSAMGKTTDDLLELARATVPAKAGFLADLGATIHLLTSSPLSITCVIDRDHSADAVRALHEEFIRKKGVFQCA